MAKCATCGSSSEERAIVATYHDQIAWWRGQDRELAVADPAIDAAGRCIACGLIGRDREVVDNVDGQVIDADAKDWERANGIRRGRCVAGLHVGATPFGDGRLIVRDVDPDDDGFVLALGEGDHVTLIGWTVGRNAKRYPAPSDPGSGGSAIWFVPQSALCPLPTFQVVLDITEDRRNSGRTGCDRPARGSRLRQPCRRGEADERGKSLRPQIGLRETETDTQGGRDGTRTP